MATIIWGHNPGAKSVKDSWSVDGGARKDAKPYEAVIAPWVEKVDFGIASQSTERLEVVLPSGGRYIVGDRVARVRGAIRQSVNGRIMDDSPVYASFVQASIARITKHKPSIYICSALPSGYMSDTNIRALEAHLRAGLKGHGKVEELWIRNEAGALVYHEALLDSGQPNLEARDLAGLVLSCDIGGGTLNRTVVERLEPIDGESASPPLGSMEAIRKLANRLGISLKDAEAMLLEVVETGSGDSAAVQQLRDYQQAVIDDLVQAWAPHYRRAKAIFFAGGTVHWLTPALKKVYPNMRIVGRNPQQSVAIGLYRFAAYQVRKRHASKA